MKQLGSEAEKVRPCRACIQALVHAQIGGNPDSVANSRLSISTVLIGRVGRPGVRSVQWLPPSSERKTRPPPVVL